MYDVFYIKQKNTVDRKLEILKERFPLIKIVYYENQKADAVLQAQKKSLTNFFWLIDPDYTVHQDFNFDYKVSDWDKKYVHIWKTIEQEYKGVYLIPKDYLITKKEAEYLFFVNKKEISTVVSKLEYNQLILGIDCDFFETIVCFQQTCSTSMFWLIEPDSVLTAELEYAVSVYDQKYVHEWQSLSGNLGKVRLIPKTYSITKKEADYLFFINKKEMPEILSKIEYDCLKLNLNDDNFQQITNFQKECKTSMFYVEGPDCKITEKLNYEVPLHDKIYVHEWIAENSKHTRLNLIPKSYKVTKREADHLFFINKKPMPEIVCKEEYDIIFISYNEINADENWKRLSDRFPRAKRVHGVSGIHNAHKKAALLSTTSMFWVVDGDAIIVNDFNLDFVVDPWDKDCVFVWKSENPVNGLTYGYGGVKLLPTELTKNLDVNTVDMTTSISSKFKSVSEISNITAFNTDEFSTWRSAFRECVKLSSKIISEQNDTETIERLEIWCTKGKDAEFGTFSIQGAKIGRDFGNKHKEDPTMLSKINDWQWLRETFSQIKN